MNIEIIKKKLMERKDELEGELSRLSREQQYEKNAADPTDIASASTLEELNISIQNNEMNEYKRIIKALTMIEEGTYGVCTDCGQAISEKRLLLFPNATRCLVCQEISEEKA